MQTLVDLRIEEFPGPGIDVGWNPHPSDRYCRVWSYSTREDITGIILDLLFRVNARKPRPIARTARRIRLSDAKCLVRRHDGGIRRSPGGGLSVAGTLYAFR
ncbi:hypothetical protein GCM10010116_61440 [Microbispora rosea subsp. aerata]|nr:hypothetical protein GCM10010116_61440 [Microbispora rosea subsp. aerata]